MTTFTLRASLSQELTDLIARLGMAIVVDDGLTPEETRLLRTWLQAARAKHHEELREARGRAPAEVIDFERIARVYEGRPSDTEPAA